MNRGGCGGRSRATPVHQLGDSYTIRLGRLRCACGWLVRPAVAVQQIRCGIRTTIQSPHQGWGHSKGPHLSVISVVGRRCGNILGHPHLPSAPAFLWLSEFCVSIVPLDVLFRETIDFGDDCPLRVMGKGLVETIPGQKFLAILVAFLRFILKLGIFIFANLAEGRMTLK